MKKLLSPFLLTLIFVAASWSLFHPQIFRVHDYVHAARIAEITRALSDGHFPVRWSANFGYGYGMPLFEFYAPLPYYIGSLFYWLGLDVVLVIKLLFAGCTAATLVGAYLLGKKLFGRWGGLVTAAALTLAPYRAVNLFVRGALSEAWGIMALPWILLGIIKVINQEKFAWQLLVVSLAVMMLSHNLTVMMFVPFSLLFALLFYLTKLKLVKNWQQQAIKTGLQLLASYGLAVGLSAFYLLPAFLEKSFTKVEAAIIGGYFDYTLHFLYLRQFFEPNWQYGGSIWGPVDDISFFLGWGQLLAVMGLGGLLIWQLGQLLIKSNTQKNLQVVVKRVWQLSLSSLGYLLLTLGALYLTLARARWFWRLLPLLKFVQFPWRFLTVAIVFLALVAGSSVRLVKDKKLKAYYSLVLLLIIVAGNFYFFRPEKYLADAQSLYYTDASKIQQQMSQILPDYIPVQMAEQLNPPDSLILSEVDQKDYQV
ncbi:MAG: hypothetical protein GF390_00365, partial [Candidatus Pacebacteria bacterium]|nr:hypothetical protein [Candidatus Paceibacterota bacterium]